MISGGSSTQSIKEFLEQFDNDPIKAVEAIRRYVQTESMKQRQADYVPKGPAVLEARDITKVYKLGKQRVEALRGVSLTIHEGEFVALTGASGSGKSTLLQLIGGLDKPTSGDISYGDVNLAKLSDAKLSEFRNRTIGFVFQFFYLQPFLHLQQNLEVPAMFARADRQNRAIQTKELAERVGLGDRLLHLPKELSGGQMQRVAIARALVNNPKIILADEPTGNLDSKNSASIIDLFEQIRREFGTTIVIVTHDPSIAARADREIVVSDGRLA